MYTGLGVFPASTVSVLPQDIVNAPLYKVGPDGDLEAFGEATGRWWDKLQTDPALYWLAVRHGFVPQSPAGYITTFAAQSGQDPAITNSPEYPEFYRLLLALINVINRGDVQRAIDAMLAINGKKWFFPYTGLPHVMWAPFLEDAIAAELRGGSWVMPSDLSTVAGGGSSTTPPVYQLTPTPTPQPDSRYPIGVQFLGNLSGVTASFPPPAWYIVGFRRVTVYDRTFPEGGNVKYGEWQHTPRAWNVRQSKLTDQVDAYAGLWATRPSELEPTASWALNLHATAGEVTPAATIQSEQEFLAWLRSMLPNVQIPPEWQQEIQPIFGQQAVPVPPPGSTLVVPAPGSGQEPVIKLPGATSFVPVSQVPPSAFQPEYHDSSLPPAQIVDTQGNEVAPESAGMVQAGLGGGLGGLLLIGAVVGLLVASGRAKRRYGVRP